MSFSPQALGAKCHLCPLKNCTPVPSEVPDGNGPGLLAIVGEAPGEEEEKNGRPFIGASGRELDAGLRAAGLDRRKAIVTNAMLCRPPVKGNKLDVYLRRLKKEDDERHGARLAEWEKNGRLGEAPKLVRTPSPMECCKPRLENEVKNYRNFITLGKVATNIIAGTEGGILPVRGGIRHLEGTEVTPERYVMPTIHPAFVLRQQRWRHVFRNDLFKAARRFNGVADWKPPEITYNPSPEQLREFLSRYRKYAFDTETDWIESLTARLRCIAIGTDKEVYVVGVEDIKKQFRFYPPHIEPQIRRILKEFFEDENIAKISHNGGSYDRIVLREQWGIDLKNNHDTMLLHRSVESELPHGLGYVGSLYSEAPSWKCYDGATEILTKYGWTRFDQLKPGVPVAQWDRGLVSFVVPRAYVEQEYAGLVWRLQDQATSLVVTPDHGMVYRDRNTNELVRCQVQDLPASGHLPHTGLLAGGESTIEGYSPEETLQILRLLVAVQADGHWQNPGKLQFGFTKTRKIERLESILTALSIPYRKVQTGTKNPRTDIFPERHPVVDGIWGLLGKEKRFGSWLLTWSESLRRAFLDEIPFWDGTAGKEHTQYNSVDATNADWVQAVAVVTGRAARKYEYENKNGDRPVFRVALPNGTVRSRAWSKLASLERTTEDFKGRIYCVSVPAGFLVVRRDGKVTIAQNTDREGQKLSTGSESNEALHEYCLFEGTPVVLADGSTLPIETIVRQQLEVSVLSLAPSGALEPRRVIDWHYSVEPDVQWRQLRVARGNARDRGLILTQDHRVLTDRGWLEARAVQAGDFIADSERSFSSDERAAILGTLLGDTIAVVSPHIRAHGVLAANTASLFGSHSEKSGFSSWKAAELDVLCLDRAVSARAVTISGRAGVAGPGVPYRSPSLFQIADLARFVYDEANIRRLRVSTLNLMGPRGWAWWVVDDGCLQKNSCGRDGMVLSTQGFLPEDVRAAVTWFRERFGPTASGVDNVIRLGRNAAARFAAEIAPYVPPTARYKLPGSWADVPYIPVEKGTGPFWREVIESGPFAPDTSTKQGFYRAQRRYCLDVEQNHNFFTSSGLVHNCALDTAVTYGVFEPLAQQVVLREQQHVYNYDRQMQEICVEMHSNGMYVDQEKRLKEEMRLLKARHEILQEIQVLAAAEGFKNFNPGSIYQLRDLFFDRWQLVPSLPEEERFTESQDPSTNDLVLRNLLCEPTVEEGKRNFIKKVRRYRKLQKVLGTYVCKLRYEDMELNADLGWDEDEDWVDAETRKFYGLVKQGIVSRKTGRMYPGYNAHVAVCVDPSTWILTREGPRQIGNLSGFGPAQTERPAQGLSLHDGESFAEVSHLQNPGVCPTLTVTTVLGVTLTATPHHRVQVAARPKFNRQLSSGKWEPVEPDSVWARMDELTKDSYIRVPFGMNVWAESAPTLPKAPLPALQTNALEIVLPHTVDEDLAFFAGIYNADGSLHDANGSFAIRISDTTGKRHAVVCAVAERLFGPSAVRVTKEGVAIQSVALKPWVALLGFGRRIENKKCPWWVLASPRSIVEAYLRGLAFDSWVGVSAGVTPYWRYTGVESLCREVQMLLLNLGIVSMIRSTNDGRTWQTLAMGDEAQLVCAVTGQVLPPPTREKDTAQGRPKYIRRGSALWLRVTRIQDGGLRPVLDVTVPETHQFWANGTVSHNTGRLSSSKPLNAQNFPKGLRALVVAAPGNVLVGADADQLELRIAAAHWQVPLYLRAFADGKDPHSMTAYTVFGDAFLVEAGLTKDQFERPGKFVGKCYDEKGAFDGDKGPDAKKMRDLSKAVQYASCLRTSLISVLDSRRAVQISDITPGDWVWAWSKTRLRYEPTQVKHAWCHGQKGCVKVTFAWGKSRTGSVVVTPDHPMLLRNGALRHAGSLRPGDRLLPFSRKVYPGSRYASLRPLNRGASVDEHRVVKGLYANDKTHVHHKDENPLNNLPENLEFLSPRAHAHEHKKARDEGRRNSSTWRAAVANPLTRSKASVVAWKNRRRKIAAGGQDKTFGPRASKLDAVKHLIGLKTDLEVAQIAGCTQELVGMYRKAHDLAPPVGQKGWLRWLLSQPLWTRLMHDHTDTEIVRLVEEEFGVRFDRTAVSNTRKLLAIPAPNRRASWKGRKSKLDPWAEQAGHRSDSEIAKEANCTPEAVAYFRKVRGIPAYWRGEVGGTNHTVVSVEVLDGEFEVWDLEVEHEDHNFALEAGIFVHNSQYMGSPETVHKLVQKTEVPAKDPVTGKPLDDGTTVLPYAQTTLRRIREMRDNWLQGAPEFEKGWEKEIEEFRRQGYLLDPVHKRRRDFLDGADEVNQIVNFKIQCVPGFVRVLTDRGYIRIEELEGLLTTVWTGNRWAQATCIRKDTVPLCEVRTDHALTLYCDQTHKLKTSDRSSYVWKEVSELSAGNRVAVDLARPLEFGTQWDEEDAYMLGLWLADGSITLRARGTERGCVLQWAVGNTARGGPESRAGNAQVRRITLWAEARGLTASSRPAEGCTAVSVYADARLVAALWGIPLKTSARTKRIPERVWRACLGARKAFFRGLLDGDGYQNPQGAVLLTLCNPELLEDVAVLIRTVGVDALKLSGPLKTNKDGETVAWRLSLAAAHVHRELQWGRAAKYRSNNTLPQFECARVHARLEPKTRSHAVLKSRIRGHVGAKSTSPYAVREMGVEDIYDHATVKSVVTHALTAPVYTMCVNDEEHQYVADGFISKNSAAAGLMNNAIFLIFDEVVKRRRLHNWPPGCGIVNQCHDSIVLEVPEGEAEWAADLLNRAMNQMHPNLPGVRFTSGAKIGKTWKETG